ncbi:MAG: hypothetical protein QXU99_05780 [Candidatus Bathyarchaeia archaeon]
MRSKLYVLISIVLTINICLGLSSAKQNSNYVEGKILWEKTYGGKGDDRAFHAARLGDGFAVVGSSTSLIDGKTTAWIIRIDAEGSMVWNRTYAESSNGEFRHVCCLLDGFLLVGNLFSLSRNWDGYIVRTDIEGKPIWNITVGGENVDKLFSAIELPDGFVLVGLTASFGNGGSDVWVIKLVEDGSIVWNKTYGWQMDDAARSVAPAGDGGFIVAGYTNSTGQGDYDFLALKLNSEGEMLWNETYGGSQSEKAYAITAVQSGYVIAGDTRSKGEGDSDAWVIKIDAYGNLLWEMSTGGADFDQPTCITPSAYGGLLVGGFTFSFGNGERDFWLFKVNDEGNVLWSSTIGRTKFEEAYAVVEVTETEFVMVGWTNSIGAGHYDFYIAKLCVQNNNGNDWLHEYAITLLAVIVICVLLAGIFFFRIQRSKKQTVRLRQNLTQPIC